MQTWIFSIITPVFSVTWSFRNHSDMLIYYECVKLLCCFNIVFWSMWYFLMNTKLKEIFSNNISLYYVFFIHLTHPSWIKVLISLKKKEKNLLIPNFWIALYIVTQNYFLNKSCSFKNFINQRNKIYHRSPKKYEAAQRFPTLIINQHI